METAELNHLDELYLHLDRPDEPWGVKAEPLRKFTAAEKAAVAAVIAGKRAR